MIRFMHLAYLLALLFIATSGGVAVGGRPELLPWPLLEEGWIQLFDGQSLFGWQATGDADWEVAGGELRTRGEKAGFLMTTTEWAEYELQFEFRAPASTNSGVFLRSALEPTDPARDCYELNIAPAENPYPTGSLVGRQRVAGTLTPNPSPKGRGERPEWRTVHVTAWGGWIKVVLDGEQVLDYSDPAPVRLGHIGLQSNRGEVAFRNIRLRPIELSPLLTTNDLSNFRLDRAEESRFAVEDEMLHVTGGPGQVETRAEFANFVLQLDCKVNGDGLNSGVFFRALRDGKWAGYESQIHNGYKDGDPTRPVDFGTGGIYRRQPARRVVAEDGEWFAKTIVANGPHIAVWVNGYQVSDWTDTRPERENARDGLKLGKGTIAIQGHDPGTDILFRDIRVAELPR